MAGKILLTDVCFRLRDQADKFLSVKDTNQARADKLTRDSQCGAVVKISRKNHRTAIFLINREIAARRMLAMTEIII
jgi:hypothetical protein